MRHLLTVLFFSVLALAGTPNPPTNLTAQVLPVGGGGGYGNCLPPNYCAYLGTDVIQYSGSITAPPALNASFTDPAFNRKIWRITDTNSDAGRMFAPSWGTSGLPSGTWNKNMTLLILGSQTGKADLFKIDVSNPSAPSVVNFTCSYSTTPGTCAGGIVYANAGLQSIFFANTENYVSYGWSNNTTDGNGALVKVDWGPTVSSNGATAPTRTVMFNPFSSGKCMSGLTYALSSAILVSGDDQYFWGQSTDAYHYIVYKAGAADCFLIDTSGDTSNWVKSGDTTWSGPNGNFSFVDENNNSASYPGACNIHGYYYEPVLNAIFISSTGGSCGNKGSWLLWISSTVAESCTTGQCTGHGFGLSNIHSSTDIGMGILAFHDSYQFSFRWKKHALPWPADQVFGHTVSLDQATAGGLDQHAAVSLASNSTSYPIWGAVGWIMGGTANNPPQTTPATIASPYESEIDVWRVNDTTNPPATIYRYVHTYTAAGNYTIWQYSAGAMPALSPDNCWVIWGSNWWGQLGDYSKTPKTLLCDASDPQNCRYDTFMTYLCGGVGT